MEKLTFDYIREHGLLIYEYIRGSNSQGINTDASDIDIGGVYICPPESILGIGLDYQDQIEDETHDTVWYELNKFIKLLCNANPSMLEALFVDDEFVIYEHPIMTEIKKHRQLFVTQDCFQSFSGYGRTQLKKCAGLNKLFRLGEIEKKTPLDYCYTFYNQGSTKMINWLDNRGLMQKHCGLVLIPNMHNNYGVYYDWKAHFNDLGIKSLDDFQNKVPDKTLSFIKMYLRPQVDEFNVYSEQGVSDDLMQTYDYLIPWFENLKLQKYTGIVANDGSSMEVRHMEDTSTEHLGVMLNSVEKGAKPICYMCYNAEGFAKNQQDYKRYTDWVKNRNPKRYSENKGTNYDAKNVCHCMRLISMGIEIAKTGEVHVNRRNIDREYLLDVRNRKYTYEELMNKGNKLMKEFEKARISSTIPLTVDKVKVDELLVRIRKMQLGIK